MRRTGGTRPDEERAGGAGALLAVGRAGPGRRAASLTHLDWIESLCEGLRAELMRYSASP